MAIVFTESIDEAKLRLAYNNDIISYYSNTSIAVQSWSEIVVRNFPDSQDLFRVRLYPAPDGTFFFNFQSYVAALINTKNFADTLDPQINGLETDSYIYSAAEGIFKDLYVEITVMHDDDTEVKENYSLKWIAGVEQLGDFHDFRFNRIYLLSSFNKLSDIDHHLKYWQGYPFDISIYSPQVSLTLKNLTNSLQQVFPVPGKVSRLVFSDGRTDVTIEDLLPLIEGYNKLRLSQPSGSERFITLEKIPFKCGVYVKWLNQYGGFSYWLFENTYAVDRNSKQLGEIDTDMQNLNNTLGRSAQIGKESQDIIRAIADSVTAEEKPVFETIIDSPKIYLFTGQPFARNSYYNWVEISLKTSSIRVKNSKQSLTNFTLDFELPMRYTQTL